MKIRDSIRPWIQPCRSTTFRFLGGIVLAGATLASQAQDLIINSFDNTNTVNAVADPLYPAAWKYNGGLAGSVVWAESVDADNNPSSGSIYVTVPYAGGFGNNWQEMQIGRQTEYPWPYIDLAPYANIEFDIKVDVANSLLATNESGTPVSYCGVEPIIQQWAWTPLGSTVIPNSSGWLHVVRPLGGATTMANPILSFHWEWWQVPQGPMSFWVDNIKLTTPPQPPPPIVMQRATPGLQIIASQLGQQYQRQMVHTVNDSAWVGLATPVTPVEYSVTITNYPNPALYSNYLTQFFWVPDNSMPFGKGDSAVDWNTTNDLVLAIGDNPDGTAYVSLAYKTNSPGSNPITTVATLNAAGMLGQWSVVFSNDTDVTIIAPDGTTTNAALPADVAAYFAGPLTTYVGNMPQNVPNIGQQAAFSNVKITGTSYPVDDSFTAFDPLVWGKIGDGAGIFPSPADTAWQLSWKAPAIGAILQQTSDLSDPNSWLDATVAGATAPITTYGQRVSLIPASAVAADQGYFGLFKREAIKLQTLLASETNAPGTVSGKGGAVDPVLIGVNTPVTINAVDGSWHVRSGVAHVIQLSISPEDPLAIIDENAALANGTVSILVNFGTPGTYTITATDVTDGSLTASTSSSITVTE